MPFRAPVFKTGALANSANSPQLFVVIQLTFSRHQIRSRMMVGDSYAERHRSSLVGVSFPAPDRVPAQSTRIGLLVQAQGENSSPPKPPKMAAMDRVFFSRRGIISCLLQAARVRLLSGTTPRAMNPTAGVSSEGWDGAAYTALRL